MKTQFCFFFFFFSVSSNSGSLRCSCPRLKTLVIQIPAKLAPSWDNYGLLGRTSDRSITEFRTLSKKFFYIIKIYLFKKQTETLLKAIKTPEFLT